MRVSQSVVSCAVAMAMVMPLVGAKSARAEENGIVPYLSGVMIGVPAGAAPPPGLYLSDNTYDRPMKVVNGSGASMPVKIDLVGTSLSAVWSPGVQLLGGNYYAFIKQPFGWNTTTAFGHASSNSGNFNTIISPLNISWQVAPGLFVAAGLTGYLDDATYSATAPVKMGNNFWTVEPSLAVSYLANGLNLSALAAYDINTKNTATNYQSGQTLSVDLTATKRFGAWTAGVGGYIVQQVTSDKINGITYPATPFNSAGNKLSQIALGPVVGYDFGRVQVTGYLTQDVQLKNAAGGTSFWLRLSTRF